MVRGLAFLLLLITFQTGFTQFNPRLRYGYLTSDQLTVPKTMMINQVPSTNFSTPQATTNVINYRTPWLGFAPANTNQQVNAAFWFGSVRTQKLGKFGTDHFFDMNGNLRNSSTFWNVRSKSNRGFKLYFSSR